MTFDLALARDDELSPPYAGVQEEVFVDCVTPMVGAI